MSREERAKKREGSEANGSLIHMAHNGAPRASDTDPDKSEEDPGTAEQVARLQQQMNEQVERQVAARMREERERTAQDTATPRRGGPPGPGTPASILGKRIHSIVQRMWEETEMGVSQAFKEYEDAVDEVEAAVNRNPRRTSTHSRWT